MLHAVLDGNPAARSKPRLKDLPAPRYEALPERLATATLAARLADLDRAAAMLAEPVRFTSAVR